MPDIGASELLLIAVVAILVIGPKDLPLAMRTAGRWIGKMRKLTSHFRTGMDAMIREAEMEEMEKKWAAQNQRIMSEHPDGAPAGAEQTGAYPSGTPAPKASEPSATSDTPGATGADDAAQSGTVTDPASTQGDAPSGKTASGG